MARGYLANHSPQYGQRAAPKEKRSETIRAPQPPRLLSASSAPRARAVTARA